jgi:hypothetical protein
MKTATALTDALVKAFDPPASGLVGIVDNLLQLCRGGDLELAWRSNGCHVRREIHLGPDPEEVFSAHFVNTAAEQSLRLVHVSHNGRSAADQPLGSGGVGQSTARPSLQ